MSTKQVRKQVRFSEEKKKKKKKGKKPSLLTHLDLGERSLVPYHHRHPIFIQSASKPHFTHSPTLFLEIPNKQNKERDTYTHILYIYRPS